ncbi:MAG TPA: phosphoribosylaminoimidazolesuccinocarboxamide synthase [Cyclobacteriaceae bacterium]|nr:phosphoribosylaminoimidazolesuccinocarboxamide synthase [Cyclobacteriaceae bacterium]
MTEGIKETKFSFPGQTSFYRGKVRDVYMVSEKLIMVATDRISAFDVILPRPIPYKGQILNQLAARSLKATEDIVPNWLEAVPDPNVSIGKKCKPIPVEMVIRGYLVGHAWREYKEGKRFLSGAPMPENLKENDPFPEPIITPTTKAEAGHDLDISRNEIIDQGIVERSVYEKLEEYTLKLFERGRQMALKQKLILADTKYEFGLYGDKIYLIDEVHTPDSSRYFYLEGFDERQEKGKPQKQLSKEFVRQWLIANGFQGLEGQKMPEMRDEIVNSITDRYIELYENFTGERFIKTDYANILDRINKNILTLLS